jgi:PhnB protein
MSKASKPVPEGFHTVTPHLVTRGAADAIEFYKKALGAQELSRMSMPDGKIGHAELKIGDSIIFLADEMPSPDPGHAKSPQTVGATTTSLHLYVPDVDTAFKKAISAGAKETMAVTDMFWGDRYGTFTDPFGHSWGIATHKEDLSKQEMDERARAFFASMQQQRKTA